MPTQDILLHFGTPPFIKAAEWRKDWNRVAVIFVPHVIDGEPHVDEDLFFDVLEQIASILQYGDVIVYAGEAISNDSLIEARARYFQTPPEDRDFPDRFEFKRQGQVVAVIEIEKWAMVGGPAPYHDSHSIAVYTPSELNAKISSRVRHAASRHHATVRDHLSS